MLKVDIEGYLGKLPKYERAIQVAAFGWTGIVLILQLSLITTQQHLPAKLRLSAPGTVTADDPVIDRATLVTIGWWLVISMATLTVLGLLLAYFRVRCGKYLSLLAALAGVSAVPYAVPSVISYYIGGFGRTSANISAVASLILLIATIGLTFGRGHWFNNEASEIRRKAIWAKDVR